MTYQALARFASPFTRLAESALAIALPLYCPICGAAGRRPEVLSCDACRGRLVRLTKPVCPACRRYRDYDTQTCPGAHATVSPAIAWALGAFDYAWRSIVHELKYRGDRSLAGPVGTAMAELVGGSLPADLLVVSVPTSEHKIRERGFGHAERIADRLADRLSAAFDPLALRFTRSVKDQTRLSGPRRIENLKGALVARDPQRIAGRSLLVVDDVLTTGATLREAARALEEAGADEVRAVVVAVNSGGLPDGPP